MRLLPLGRLTPAILPVVGRASRTVESRNNVGCGVFGKLVRKGHAGSVAHKNKSAMPKIKIAKNRHCRHNSSTMKTKIADIAEHLETIERGQLPYAGDDNAEVKVCETAIAELLKVEAAAKRLRKQLTTRKSEYQELINFGKGVAL